jgi:tetratricopeptide (TPR) repeat protein
MDEGKPTAVAVPGDSTVSAPANGATRRVQVLLAGGGDPSARADDQVEAAGLLLDVLGDAEGAERALDAALRLDPGHPAALSALEQVYLATGRLEALADRLERAGEAAGALPARIACWRRAAGVRGEWCGQAEQAALLWLRVLELDPANEGAYAALERWYGLTERWAELASVLDCHGESAGTVAERIGALRRAAVVVEDRLGDPERAVGLHLRILELAPENAPAFAALERIYGQAERWPELVSILEFRAASASEVPVRAASLLRAGLVVESALGDPARAAAFYRRLLDVQPGHPEGVAALARLGEAPALALLVLDPPLAGPPPTRVGDLGALRPTAAGPLLAPVMSPDTPDGPESPWSDDPAPEVLARRLAAGGDALIRASVSRLGDFQLKERMRSALVLVGAPALPALVQALESPLLSFDAKEIVSRMPLADRDQLPAVLERLIHPGALTRALELCARCTPGPAVAAITPFLQHPSFGVRLQAEQTIRALGADPVALRTGGGFP